MPSTKNWTLADPATPWLIPLKSGQESLEHLNLHIYYNVVFSFHNLVRLQCQYKDMVKWDLYLFLYVQKWYIFFTLDFDKIIHKWIHDILVLWLFQQEFQILMGHFEQRKVMKYYRHLSNHITFKLLCIMLFQFCKTYYILYNHVGV